MTSKCIYDWFLRIISLAAAGGKRIPVSICGRARDKVSIEYKIETLQVHQALLLNPPNILCR